VARLWVGLSDLNQLVQMTASSEATIGSGELSSRQYIHREEQRETEPLAFTLTGGPALSCFNWIVCNSPEPLAAVRRGAPG
jgi:hypothetical protein